MRTIWTVISVLAVGNLLAILGLAAWLGLSGRIDLDRARAIREMLAETIAAQEAREKEEADAAAAAALAAAGEERGVALSSAELVSLRLDRIEADRERRRRLEQEARDLAGALAQREAALQREREAFEAERRAHEDHLEAIRQTDGDQQFRKAVKVLDGLKAEDGAAIIAALIESGEDGALESAGEDAAGPGLRLAGIERAVSYLNAMQERSRLKLMGELSANQPELAAELLERLRSRGIAAETAQAP